MGLLILCFLFGCCLVGILWVFTIDDNKHEHSYYECGDYPSYMINGVPHCILFCSCGHFILLNLQTLEKTFV